MQSRVMFRTTLNDELFREIRVIAKNPAGNLLAWYRELAKELASRKRLRAARDLVCAFLTEAEQWVMTYSLLDAIYPDAGKLTAASMDEVLQLELPGVPALSWLADRAIEGKAWAVAAAAAAKMLSLARSGPVGPVAAALCGRTVAKAGQMKGVEASHLADNSDQEGVAKQWITAEQGAQMRALCTAMVLCAEGDFATACRLLGHIGDNSSEWTRAREIFPRAARQGALEQCLFETKVTTWGGPRKMAAVGLAEAGLIKEAIQVANFVVGELARPNTMTAVGTTFLWMDKFGPALQVGALAGNFHLIVEVAKRAADLGLPEWVAQAMCLVNNPTFRLVQAGS